MGTVSRFRKITQALKAELIIPPVDEPIAIDDANPANDLRYGSEISKHPAYPSWFGLHDSFYPYLVKTPDGKTVSYTQLYTTQPWVYATVQRYRTFMQLVPPKVYRRTDEDSRVRLRPRDHPLAAAIERPWRGGNGNDLMDSILTAMLVHGNATVEVESGARGSMQFIPRDWRKVTPTQVASHYVSGWTFEDEDFDDEVTITPERMLHVTWESPIGPIGISPLAALGVTLSNEIAAQAYAKHNFANMASPSLIVQAAAEFFGGIEQEERDDLLADFREQITAKYTGAGNAGVPMMLPPGFDAKPFSHTAQEAVLIEQRKLNREEVEGVFLIPPPLVGQLDNATYSNIKEQREMGYADSLGPQAVKIANAFNSQIVRDLLGEDDVYVEFDLAGVLRGNPIAQSENLQRLFNMGVLSRNEIRSMLNRDRIPADVDPTADEYFIQANNMAPASSLTNNQPTPQ